MSRQYKIIIIICVLGILCNIGIKYSLINAQNKKIVMLQKVIATARSGSYLKTAASGIDGAASQGEIDKNEIEKIIHKIPHEFTFTQYAANLRELMDTNDLFMENNLSFKPEKIKQPDLLKYNTNIAVTGDYKQIKQFIADILNLPGVACFDSVNLLRDRDDKEKIKFKFKLSLFFKRG